MSKGKNLHMEIGFGDIANRIITVGSEKRARLIAGNLSDVKEFKSSRDFTVFTGDYDGIQISIVSIGMGAAMMDFFVRETRAITTGPLAIVRYVRAYYNPIIVIDVDYS